MVDLDMYDIINTMAMRLLSYNNDKKGAIVFYNYNEIDKQILWLLNIGMGWASAYDKQIYISCNWITFLKLKYIYKIKKLKRVQRLKPGAAMCLIHMHDFIKETTKFYGKSSSFVEDIYDIYYNRRKK